MNQSLTVELARWVEDDLGVPQNLAPVYPGGLTADIHDWDCARASTREAWGAIMGRPGIHLV